MSEIKKSILPDPVPEIDADWNDLILPLGFKENFESRIIEPILKNKKPKDFGIIMFGPPGTGKTTIPYAIAKKTGWKIRVLSPKIFLGVDGGIESAIKRCFEDITGLYREIDEKTGKIKIDEKTGKIKLKKIDTIFVFDEIDELVTSRDEGSDKHSRLLTTMMLPLFQDLRDDAKDCNIMFFVMTNHIEIFDPAIKRKGRFDLIIPVGPPDRPARYLQYEVILNKLTKEYVKDYNIDLIWNVKDQYGNSQVSLDVLSKVSVRLGWGDIKGICERAVEQRRLMQLPSFDAFSQKTPKPLSLYTTDFLEWVNRYRNSNADLEKEIVRFYQEYAIYSRGASPYSVLNNIQEKIHHEFSSLHIKHNLKNILDIDEKNWQVGDSKTMIYSLVNLTELSKFKGTINVRATNAGIKKSLTSSTIIHAGNDSPEKSIVFTPLRPGQMTITFTIKGEFTISGIDSLLQDKSAIVSGTIKKTESIKVVKKNQSP